jgi:hypothetical protein
MRTSLGKTLQCWDLASAGKPYEIAAADATEIAVGYSLRSRTRPLS